MAIQVFIGIIAEGTTDILFLESVVERTFIDIAFECNNDIEPYVKSLHVKKTGLGFNEYIEKAAREATEIGMSVLCVHADADDKNPDKAYDERINPAKLHLANVEDVSCRIFVPVVPVYMMEAWMLADKDLLKSEIGTTLSDKELGMNKMPELFVDPKETISDAIRIARREVTKRRRKDLDITDLYSLIGAKVALEKLEMLPSYRNFKEEVRAAYRELNLLV